MKSSDVLTITERILAPRYDTPRPVPDCHLDWWDLCCSDYPQVAIAAPRGHAKSTAITYAYVIASILMGESRHVLIISANEGLAGLFVSEIRNEFNENEELIEVSNFLGWKKESETELIGQFGNGRKFRIFAKGALQRMRGVKWERTRPDLVIGDDMEDDEIVLNDNRRDKFKRWLYGAVRPIVKEGGKLRLVGTIVHMDSFLENTMPPEKDDKTVILPLKTYSTRQRGWVSVKYRAHSLDFEHILWPEMFSQLRLQQIRADFAEQGLLDVYAQEYLNDPIDESTAYFRISDFTPMTADDLLEHQNNEFTYYAAADLAVTEDKKSARTCFVIGGTDSKGFLHIVDVQRGRWDSLQITEEFFSIQERYNPEVFRVESENIAKSIGPFLYKEMEERNIYINLDAKNPSKDKIQRAQTGRARMRAGKVKFNKEADWYADFEAELRRFPRAASKDQVDAFAWLALLLDEMNPAPTRKEVEEDAWMSEYQESYYDHGRSDTTGY